MPSFSGNADFQPTKDAARMAAFPGKNKWNQYIASSVPKRGQETAMQQLFNCRRNYTIPPQRHFRSKTADARLPLAQASRPK